MYDQDSFAIKPPNSENVPICLECDYHVVVDRQKESHASKKIISFRCTSKPKGRRRFD